MTQDRRTAGPRVLRDDAAGIAAAVEVLRAGGVVALPTDTVYGIAVALDTPGGIERLFAVKERPPEKGIALLLAGTLQAWHVGVPTAEARKLAAACWPGPLTLVLERAPGLSLPEALTGGGATIGVRVPDHPTPRALAEAIGPLPTTSANLSGAADTFEATEVVSQLGDRIDLVLDGGRSGGAAASTVVDCTRDPVAILREGVLGERRIREILA